MSPQQVVSGVLLVVAVAVALLSAIGVIVASSVHDRFHFTTPAAVVSSVLVAAAVVVRESFDARGVKAILVAAILIALNPILTQATVRAVRLSRFGEWELQRDERDAEAAERARRRERDAKGRT